MPLEAPGSRPGTYWRDRSSPGHRPGARRQGVQPGQWEALGKTRYCVFGNPVIIMFAVTISVSVAIFLCKSVPTCVSCKGTFQNIHGKKKKKKKK